MCIFTLSTVLYLCIRMPLIPVNKMDGMIKIMLLFLASRKGEVGNHLAGNFKGHCIGSWELDSTELQSRWVNIKVI